MSQRSTLANAAPIADSLPAIEVHDLVHRYPGGARKRRRGANTLANGSLSVPAAQANARPALDGVSLQINRGEMFAILGPNGGGKSTLFRILSTLLRPSSGSVKIFGRDVLSEPSQARRLIGVVFQNPSLDGKLTAGENLLHQGHLYGLRGADLQQRIKQLLSDFNLADRRHDRAERLSGGMRRRVEIAKALLHEPALLLLDEPSTGLDPGARADLWQQLLELRNRRSVTVVLTTHFMEEADRCERLALLSEGKLIALDTPENLKARIGGDVITVEPQMRGSSTPAAADALASVIAERFGPWPDDSAPRVVDNRVQLEKPDGPAFVAVLGQALGTQIRSISVGQPTLDDVFMHLTGHRMREQEALLEPTSRR